VHAATPTEKRALMDSAKHIGTDVHKESISIAVLNVAGKISPSATKPCTRWETQGHLYLRGLPVQPAPVRTQDTRVRRRF
jgi:hypothetical protein